MSFRIFAFILFACCAVLIQSPAWLFDKALDMATGGTMRLQDTSGSVWNGQGKLLWLDRNLHQVEYRAQLAWQFAATGLLSGRIGWNLRIDDQTLASIAAGMSTWQIDTLRLRLPARLLIERVPHPVSKLGWQGDVSLKSQHWQCSWTNQCNGTLDLAWTDASAEMLRGHALGDYQAQLNASADRYEFSWSTLRGETRITANGNWVLGKNWQLQGSVAGDPVFLQRLPAIAGQYVRPGTQAGEYRFDVQGSAAAAR